MKRVFAKILVVSVIVMMAVSCRTVQRATRDSIQLPGLRVTRADYTLTSDVSAEAEVKVILGMFIKGADKKNIKEGRINGGFNTTIDEALAVYNLLEAHPEIDYLTNIRYVKTYTQKPFVKTYKTKIIAKGIILKTDK